MLLRCYEGCSVIIRTHHCRTTGGALLTIRLRLLAKDSPRSALPEPALVVSRVRVRIQESRCKVKCPMRIQFGCRLRRRIPSTLLLLLIFLTQLPTISPADSPTAAPTFFPTHVPTHSPTSNPRYMMKRPSEQLCCCPQRLSIAQPFETNEYIPPPALKPRTDRRAEPDTYKSAFADSVPCAHKVTDKSPHEGSTRAYFSSDRPGSRGTSFLFVIHRSSVVHIFLLPLSLSCCPVHRKSGLVCACGLSDIRHPPPDHHDLV